MSTGFPSDHWPTLGVVDAELCIPRPTQTRLVPVTRAADGAKNGQGVISKHPSGDPLMIQGHGTQFKSQLVPKGQIVLPKWTGYASAEVVEIISDTEVKIKKEWKDERAKEALSGKPGPVSKKDKSGGETESSPSNSLSKGTDYQCLPFVDQTQMYASVYEKLAQGGCLGIFPEGGSHDRTDLLPLKAGVVIMALGAMSANPGLKVKLVPVGLSYFHPDKFRSRAVVEFGAPLEASDDLVKLFEAGGEGKRKAVGDMMDLVFDGLKSVTMRAPDYETLMLIQAARRLYMPPGQHLTLPQVVELNRCFIIGYLKFKDDPRVQKLKADVQRYNKMLGWVGLRDHQVERATRAGWRSLGLLFYRLGLLLMWGSMAFPGVILNSPIIILAKIISRRKAKEALAASQVKLKGRDVVGTWKVLVSMGVAPVLYLSYAVAATYFARRVKPNLSTRSLALTPLWTIILLPAMSYSTLKISETALDIVKSLPPLFVSLLPGNQKVINDLQDTRRELQEEMQALIDELAPQVWQNFQSQQWRVLGSSATTATPPPSTSGASSRDESFVWKAKDARARSTASQALSHPLAWADERLFGWRSSRSISVNGKKRHLSPTERPLSAAEFSGEHLTLGDQERDNEAVEEEDGDDDDENDWDSADTDADTEDDEGDYEAIFSLLNPARLLWSNGPLSPRSPRSRSRGRSRSRSGSMGLSPTIPLTPAGGGSDSRGSSQELTRINMTAATTALEQDGSADGGAQQRSAGRRRRTHSLTESVHTHELAAAAKSEKQQRMPFTAASEALEAQKSDSRYEGEKRGDGIRQGRADGGSAGDGAPGFKPVVHQMPSAVRTPGSSHEGSDEAGQDTGK